MIRIDLNEPFFGVGDFSGLVERFNDAGDGRAGKAEKDDFEVFIAIG